MKFTDRIKNISSKVYDALQPIKAEPENYTVSSYSPSRGSYPSYGGTHSGGAGFPGGLAGDGAGMVIDHRRTRQNARAAVQDVPQAAAIVNRFADTVADVGMAPEPTPKHEMLGITPEAADEWSRDVEERFDLWARSKKSYRSEVMNFYQSQGLNALMQQRDNDIFCRFHYSSEKSLQNPLQLQFIDADQIRGDSYTTTWGASGEIDGIKRDGSGKETGYRIWQKDKDYKYKDVDIAAVGSKSKRIYMIHQYKLDYPGQGRGFSRLAGSLQQFQNITDFSLSKIKQAISQSAITMYVKPSLDAPASNPLVDIANEGSAGVPSAAVAQFGVDGTPATGVEAEAALPVSYQSMPEATISQPGSVGVFNLNEGEDLKPFNGNAPGDGYDKFVDAFTSYLSASMSIPLEVVLMKFNQNYSASRAALILFWRVAEIWREEMNTDFNNPVYEMWLSGEIAAGRVQAPGWSDPVLRAAWLNCRWIGTPMPNIDPMKTAKADQLYSEMGVTTLDRIARKENGSSGKANRMKIKREFSEITDSPWNPTGHGTEQPAGQNGAQGLTKKDVNAIASAVADNMMLMEE